MKVLLINGSPHKEGCTFTALSEVALTLNKEGIDTGFYWIGNKPIGGCIGCYQCAERKGCVFIDTGSDEQILSSSADANRFFQILEHGSW